MSLTIGSNRQRQAVAHFDISPNEFGRTILLKLYQRTGIDIAYDYINISRWLPKANEINTIT